MCVCVGGGGGGGMVALLKVDLPGKPTLKLVIQNTSNANNT